MISIVVLIVLVMDCINLYSISDSMNKIELLKSAVFKMILIIII